MKIDHAMTHPDYYQRVRLGGLLISDADLVEVDGLKIEDEWSEQKPTGSSGATNVFKGTKPPGTVKLTFEAVDDAGFQELRRVWDLLAAQGGRRRRRDRRAGQGGRRRSQGRRAGRRRGRPGDRRRTGAGDAALRQARERTVACRSTT